MVDHELWRIVAQKLQVVCSNRRICGEEGRRVDVCVCVCVCVCVRSVVSDSV